MEILELGLVHRDAEPALDQRLVHLQVKLEAVDAVAEAKRLIAAIRRPRQTDCLPRDVEGVGVPLKQRLGVVEVREERVFSPLLGEGNTVPADLGHPVGPYLGPEGLGYELGSEADPKHRQVLFQRRPDQADLRGQVPVFHLVGAHGAAEDHQSAVTVELGAGLGMPAEVHVADSETRFLEQGIQ